MPNSINLQGGPFARGGLALVRASNMMKIRRFRLRETSEMHIDSYRFGRIVVDARGYTGDCLIFKDTVKPDWWRKEGHKLCVEDLEAVLSAKPEVLVVGCGAYGAMQVPDEVREVLQEKGIRLEVLDTAEAAERFNELSAAGANVAAALHLTC